MLGSDAVRYAQAAERSRAETDARWHDLSVSTDHDTATEAELRPPG